MTPSFKRHFLRPALAVVAMPGLLFITLSFAAEAVQTAEAIDTAGAIETAGAIDTAEAGFARTIVPSAPATSLPAVPTPFARTETQAEAEARRAALAEQRQYENLITSLEARQGVYTEELSEAYMGLGYALRKLERHEDAREAFGKALQALRISFGLRDLRQLPVLEELVATNEAMRAWDDVNAANHLIYHVAKHNQTGTEELRMKYLSQLGDWIHRADRENLIPEFNASALRLSELYNSEIERLEALENYAGKSGHLAALYLDLAETELLEAKRKFELPITDFQTPGGGEQRSITTQQCVTGIDRNGRAFTYCTAPTEVPNLNYYLGPNAQKATEIRKHLTEVESKVVLAFNTLQDEPAAADVQTALLTEVQRLTKEYNAFIALNPR
jgi:hypothetical protein